LAKEIGLTEGYLSRIENSNTIPPIPTLERIARGLGVSISYLLLEDDRTLSGDHDPNIQIVKNKEIPENKLISESKKGYHYESLAIDRPNKTMHPYLITSEFEFGELQQHDGEEFIYVLEGSLEFLYGSKKYLLEEGDCVYYYSHIPHCGRSVGKKKSKVLAIIYDYKPHNSRV
jgi:transcriptional regulator with XRE-family HTH domain